MEMIVVMEMVEDEVVEVRDIINLLLRDSLGTRVSDAWLNIGR